MPSGQEKEVVRFGPLASFIANGVRRGDAIYLSGQVAVDGAGKVVGEGDITAQVRQSYVNVAEVLEKFGASMDDVVDETWFVTDIDDVMAKIRPVFEARAEAYGGDPGVTQTLIGVSRLVYPELLVEIKVVAQL